MISSNVTIDLQKLEKLLNKVGDLVITNSMMAQSVDNLPASEEKKNLVEKITLFQRHIVELQDYATDIRMIKFESMYTIYNNIIQEILPANKSIKLQIVGGETKVDKSLVEHLDLSIKTLITNSVLYGIETKEERTAKDKNPEATIKIIAQQLNGQMSFCIEDDGIGFDKDELDFEEEFPKIKEDNQLKNVYKIKENVEKLNGNIEIKSDLEEGFSFTITVPLTHSILDGLNIKIGDNIFILPTSSIVESIQPTKEMIKLVGDGSSALLMLRDEFIPIIRLYEFLHIVPKTQDLSQGILIIVKSGTQKAAFFIDEFLQQQQVVLKAIETNFKKVDSVAGATVRGDGSIGIIIDVKSIIENS
ncbi:chemotaxis protein CheA [Arcobacter suis]|uniref:histidine kinase n=4 Tax=Arcobacter suis TaxID=1278212 RepID=A0AAD0SS61_9BACT|nr:chemotaxis protein CheW [Arcobacter suis]AXX90412.1 CheA-like chemotaxis sensory histidine kinase [Arcobacter suis CECT 7833]